MAQETDTKRMRITGTDDSQPATACVSVSEYVDKEHAGNIIEGLLLRSDIRGRIETPETYFDGSAKSKAAMDVLMLTQGWSRYDINGILRDTTTQTRHTMETEQTISGNIKGTFHKVKFPKLKLLIPQTGYQTEIQLERSDTFCISGLDFVDGTVIQLQALNRKSSDAFITLNISEKQYPSLGGFISQRADSSVLLKTIIPDSTAFRQLSRYSFELPTVKVTGRKLKPMNSRNLMPDRFLEEGNANFERMPTMEQLLSRIGLWVSDAEIVTDDGEKTPPLRCVGKRVKNKFVPAEVKVDGLRVSDYALADIVLMNPNEIKQIEYFSPSNYEVFGNLGGIKSLYGNATAGGGLLLIYTKSPIHPSRFRRDRPLSLATVNQLGYKPAVEFYVPRNTSIGEYDYRPTVYWNPHFIIDKAGRTISLVGLKPGKRYLLTIEGVSDEGKLIYKQEVIEL